MIILGTDVESTGLEPELDQIVELGLAVYDTVAMQFLALHSDLYQTDRWSDEAEAVHHIKQSSMMKGYGRDFNPWKLVEKYKPDIIVAHNAEFDRQFTRRWPEFESIPWICTHLDLPHEKFLKKSPCGKLQHLAVDYNFESGQRHRALFDAMLCCEIAAKHDLAKILTSSKEPKYVVAAWHEGKPDYSSKDFVTQKEYLKKAGFRWDADNQRWIKNQIPESQVEKYLRLATAKPGWKAKSTSV
jgi:DNA polymerase III epsilon subunit-like protein